jgi:NitT/TauT family transport system substrate-binding protein
LIRGQPRLPSKDSINPDRVVGMDLIMPDAVTLKYIAAPLTKEQVAELVQIPPR